MTPQLRASISSVLSSIGTAAPALLSRGRAEKLYEVFILGCVVRALLRIGADVEPRDCDDEITNDLIFRYGPGLIFSPTTTPGFLLVRYGTNAYEIHTNLQVLGSSRVLHELDVCILDRTSAEHCRRHRINPTGERVRFLAECKFYGNRLPLSIGREFLGLSSEFSLRVKTLAANTENPDILRMVTRHYGTTAFETSPLHPRRVSTFIGWLAKELEHVL